MSGYDFETTAIPNVFCPGCAKPVTVYLADSTNFGNVLAICEPADHEFDYTPVNHRAILAEARRGF